MLPLERLPKVAMFDSLLIKHGFGKCLSTSPTKRSQKIHWLDDHKSHVHQLIYNNFDTIIIGDSIAAGLSRYSNVWEIFFKESLNLGIGVDRTQHLLWRVERLPVPSHLKYVIIYCGTNNISKDSPSEVANSILCIALLLKKRNRCLKIIITCIFPRVDKFSRFRIIVPQINQLLKIFASTYDFIGFLEPTKDWFGKVNMYQRIQNLCLLVQLFVSLSFSLSESVKLIHHVTLLVTSPLLRMENILHHAIM